MIKANKSKVLFLKEEFANGQGKYIYPNRESYVGDWKNGEFHGKGSLTSPIDGSKFEGKFKNGKANGHCKVTFDSGEIFEGEFKDGEFTGHGTYASPDGEKYEGEWKNFEYHGNGTQFDINGNITGKYVNGKWIKQ